MALITIPSILDTFKAKGVKPPSPKDQVSYEALGAHFLDALESTGCGVVSDREHELIEVARGPDQMALSRSALRYEGIIFPFMAVEPGMKPVRIDQFWQQLDPSFKIENFEKLPISVRGKGVAPVVPLAPPAVPAAPQAAPTARVAPSADAPPAKESLPTPVTPTPPPVADAEVPSEVTLSLDDLAASLPPSPEPEHVPSLDDLAATPQPAEDGKVETPKAKTAAASGLPLPSLQGKLKATGFAPYRHQPGASRAYFVTLENSQGERTIWGNDLERALAVANVKVGDTVSLTQTGSQAVGPGKATQKALWQVEKLGTVLPAPLPLPVPPKPPTSVAPSPTPPPPAPAAAPSVAKDPGSTKRPSLPLNEEEMYIAENARAVLTLSCFETPQLAGLRTAAMPVLHRKVETLHGIPMLTAASLDVPAEGGGKGRTVDLSARTLFALNILSRPPDAQKNAALALSKGIKLDLIGHSTAETVENCRKYLLKEPPAVETAAALLFLADKPSAFKSLLSPTAKSDAPRKHDEYLEKLVLGNANFTPRQLLARLEHVVPDARQWGALAKRPDVAAFSAVHAEEDKPHVKRLRDLAVLAKALPASAAEADLYETLKGSLTKKSDGPWEALREPLEALLEKDRAIVRETGARMATIFNAAKDAPVAYGKNLAQFTQAVEDKKRGFFGRLLQRLVGRGPASAVETPPAFVTLTVSKEQLEKIRPILEGKMEFKPTPGGEAVVNLGAVTRHVPEFFAAREQSLKQVEQRLDQRHHAELNLGPGMSI